MKKSLLLPAIFFSAALSAQNPLLNPSFENWTNGNPDNWTTNNVIGFTVPIQQNNTGHTGSKAVAGFVTQVGINTPFPPLLTSQDNGNPQPVSQLYTNLSFYYKLSLSNTSEFFMASVVISDAAQNGIGAGVIEFFNSSNTSTYTLANAPITYTPGVPAGANIMFVISDTTASGTGIQIGSNFIVDDVSLNFASGLGETSHDLLSAPFPNPASGIVNIPFRSEGQARLEMLVLDQIGREVRRIEYSGLAANQYKEVLDISAYATGLYTVRLQTDGKVLGQTSFMIGKQ